MEVTVQYELGMGRRVNPQGRGKQPPCIPQRGCEELRALNGHQRCHQTTPKNLMPIPSKGQPQPKAHMRVPRTGNPISCHHHAHMSCDMRSQL